MERDRHKDSYIHVHGKWDRLGYVLFFPMVRWERMDIGIHTYTVNGIDLGMTHTFPWYNGKGQTGVRTFIVDETDWDTSHSYLLEHSRMHNII